MSDPGAGLAIDTVAINIEPDVCWTKDASGESYAVPYNIVGFFTSDINPSTNVTYGGDLASNAGSVLPYCIGDEAGHTGVVSGTVQGPCWPITTSPSVFINEQPAVRQDDLYAMNTGNCTGRVVRAEVNDLGLVWSRDTEDYITAGVEGSAPTLEAWQVNVITDPNYVPNRGLVGDFADWLATEDGKTFLYGVQRVGGAISVVGGAILIVGSGGAATPVVLGVASVALGTDQMRSATVKQFDVTWLGPEDTYLHVGIEQVALAGGADPETAKNVATAGELGTNLAVGGGQLLWSLSNRGVISLGPKALTLVSETGLPVTDDMLAQADEIAAIAADAAQPAILAAEVPSTAGGLGKITAQAVAAAGDDGLVVAGRAGRLVMGQDDMVLLVPDAEGQLPLLFHGDTRNNATIFLEGFRPRETADEGLGLFSHLGTSNMPKSPWLSTSYSLEKASRFTGQTGEVYVISPPAGGIDVNATFGSIVPFPNELEVSFNLAENTISPGSIIGSYPRYIGSNGPYFGEFVPNPNYSGPSVIVPPMP